VLSILAALVRDALIASRIHCNHRENFSSANNNERWCVTTVSDRNHRDFFPNLTVSSPNNVHPIVHERQQPQITAKVD
jgi:hypothetical protein